MADRTHTQQTVSVGDVASVLAKIAPLEFAEPWDNVGLLIGDDSDLVQRVLLTIDLTEPVLAEAVEFGADFVLAYHPPIFNALKRLTNQPTADAAGSSIALAAARAGFAVYSPHTALDAAPDGINDWIARGICGSTDRHGGDVRALSPMPVLPATEQCKLVTFAPADSVERIRDALSTIGAGRIGEYERCSFEIRGTGTFFGGEMTNPAVGKRGELERVDEVRLEMVCPESALALAVMTLREFHPYEEPPIEIYALKPRPQRDIGPGRRVVLDQKISLRTLVKRIKSVLGVQRLRVASPPDGLVDGSTARPSAGANDSPAKIGVVGVCAGAGGSLLATALKRGCEAFITGEIRHHDVLAATARGCTVIIAGHTNTERGYLPTLKGRMEQVIDSVEIRISSQDRDPLEPM